MASVLFVNAPYPRPLKFYGQPTSLLYAASLAESWFQEHSRADDVELVNYNLWEPERFRKGGLSDFGEVIAEHSPRIVAISSTTASLPAARQLAAVAKAFQSRPLVILGGPHDDDAPRKTAEWDLNVDLSIAGDGESALRFVIEKYLEWAPRSIEEFAIRLSAEQPPQRIFGKAQIVFSSSERLFLLSSGENQLGLDDLPFAPRRLLNDAERFHYPIFRYGDWSTKPTVQVMTQRGCVAKCSFCSESQRLQRRSIGGIVGELELLRSQYDAVFFDDSTFTNLSSSRRSYVKELGNDLSRLGLEWGCQTRVDMIDRPILEGMVASGCTYIYFGVESMNDHLLGALGKNYSSQQIEETLTLCRDVGVRVGASLLLGPHDSEHRTLETVETAEHTFRKLRPFVDNGPIELISLNLFGYYPGTASTIDLVERNPHINSDGMYSSGVGSDEFPFNLVEENPAICPKGLREVAEPILLRANEILGDVIIGQDRFSRTSRCGRTHGGTLAIA